MLTFGTGAARDVSIHAPHEGERPRSCSSAVGGIVGFQSTLPTRGSDLTNQAFQPLICVSIHAPHEGERPAHSPFSSYWFYVSIHAPHEGERHDSATQSAAVLAVSIHAPHEGERLIYNLSFVINEVVSIHAPHEGERLAVNASRLSSLPLFQSTLPTRGSDDYDVSMMEYAGRVSIHAPHEGERQPSPPWRRRLKNVSIHAPHEGERRCTVRA